MKKISKYFVPIIFILFVAYLSYDMTKTHYQKEIDKVSESFQSQVTSATAEIAALKEQIKDKDRQLYELDAVSDQRELLQNFDGAISHFESQLVATSEESAVGFGFGNLRESVFPMLQLLVDGRQVESAEVSARIDRLEQYVGKAERVEGATDQLSREAIAKLRKELNGL